MAAKVQKILFRSVIILLSCLLVLFLGYLFFFGNVNIQNSRPIEACHVFEDYSRQEREAPDTPIGVVTEYTLSLDTVQHDFHLGFYTVHQYVDVYLDGEIVYSLGPSENTPLVRTVGSNWVIIPLYREDAGKELRVVLTPIYKSSLGQTTTFLYGSALSIYKQQLAHDLPQIILSGIAIFFGIVLILVSLYWIIRRKSGHNIIALALSSMMLGTWRLLDIASSPFFAPEKTTFLFYLSLTMLLAITIPLSFFSRERYRNIIALPFRIYSILAVSLFAAQLFLQLFGILDMRQTLPATRILIVLGVLLVGFSMLYEKIKHPHSSLLINESNFSLVFVFGAAVDIVAFYITKSSSNLIVTLLAFLCYVLYVGIDFIVSYNRQEQRLLDQEKELTNSRITMLMSQIRSHFIFNILNAISGMCKYDPEKADRTIVHFARYLRSNVDILQDDQSVTFHMALRHLEDYIALEQIRFGEKIRFLTEIQAEDFLIPPLILQPIVENSIKHGLTPKPDGGTVWLRTLEDGPNIRIEIEDDGVGYDTEVPVRDTAVGLKNVRFRLEHIVDGHLYIRSIPGKGTVATITIPREEAQKCM